MLAVCTGNICRSPMVEFVLRAVAAERGQAIEVRSAGTGDWHVGGPADPRSVGAMRRRGLDAAAHRAAVADRAALAWADVVVALDRGHERWLRASGVDAVLLRPFDPEANGASDVPDPYYKDDATFEAVLGMVERAAGPFLDSIAGADSSGR